MEQDENFAQICRAGLLSVPGEIFYRFVFPFIEHKDLLRLRRTCKQIKDYSDDYILNHFESKVWEINETEFTVQYYLQANLVTNIIFINNSSTAFFEDPDIPEFLRLYGNQITHLRIHHFGALISEHESNFFSNLPNLLHLELDFIDATKRDCWLTSKDINDIEIRLQKSPFPPNFKNLKTLKLNQIQGSQRNDLGYAWDFIEYCENLEYVKHPLYKGKDPLKPGHPSGHFGCVMDYIKRRHETNPDLPNLQFYDLEHYKEENDMCGNRLASLVQLCILRNVKLLNVSSHLLGTGSMLLEVPSPIISLKNVKRETFLGELENLETLVVESTEESSFEESWRWQEETIDSDDEGVEEYEFVMAEVPKWPNLKVLHLKIDSRDMLGDDICPAADTEEFLNFLFKSEPGRKREKVKELAIRFDLDKVFFKCIGKVPVPRVKDVTRTCPFVTKLVLGGWMGTNKQVTLFWKRLPLLEEVELEECVRLGNVAFVGKDREDPIFLKLKHLKKLSLKRMDFMHKITDLAFTLVFRHLKIREFFMTSNKPIQWITAAGIESLIDGNFNNSVEKFPFDGWSLGGVSEEEFKELKMRFRATFTI